MSPAIKSTKARRGGVNVQIDTAEVDPKEVTKIEKSISSRESAPTTSQTTPGADDFKRFSTVLGPPFDSERMTLKQCRQIRKDPMVAFGLHYKKVPLARANWIIDARDKNGPNAQVAAFLDAALRKIYAAFIFQRTQVYDYGFKAMVKRFILENPGGIYRESAAKESDPAKRIKPIWDEGKILPYIWKNPVGLRPELVTPKFVQTGVKTGEFDGISYAAPTNSNVKASGKSNTSGIVEYDVYHSYWATHMKHEEDGSLYGFPLTGFARDYWWSYRFLYGLNNRAFERLAIPPIIARHPIGNTVVDETTGETRPNWEIAIEAAERLRSNAVAAVPSTMATSGLDGTSNTPEWDFTFLETPTDALKVFDSRFNYLNIMKLRALWVPEQSLIEGSTSSKNVAGKMNEIFEASQQIEMEETADEVNLYWLPQLLLVNFPEFLNNGGSAKMITHGFRPEDLDFYKQIIQLMGQADPTALGDIDMVELFDRINIPLKDPRDYELEQERLANELAQGVPPIIVPTATTVGTIANPNVNPGATNGGSVPEPNTPGSVVAGFSQPSVIYVQPQATYSSAMMFADSDTDDFLSSLPDTKHYSDKTLRALSLQMRRLWQAHFGRLYPELAGHVNKIENIISLSDQFGEFSRPDFYLEFADKGKKPTKKQSEVIAKKIMSTFSVGEDTLSDLSSKSRIIMKKIADRGASLDLRRVKAKDIEISEKAWEDWLNEQTGRLIGFTHKTFENEMKTFLVNNIREGKTSSEVADAITSHFEKFPSSKANGIARSETRDAVNAGTLIASEASGLNYVKARDGEEFDQDCKDRNGTLYKIKDAWKEMRKEHTYGTLGFEPIPRLEFSIKPVNKMPSDAPGEAGVYFNNDTSTAYVLADVPNEDCKLFLSELTDWLVDQEGVLV